MDIEQPLSTWWRRTLRRFFPLCFLGLILCCSSSESGSDRPGSAGAGLGLGQEIYARDMRDSYLLEVTAPTVVSIGWTSGQVDCTLNSRIESAWRDIRSAVSHDSRQVRKQRVIDPNFETYDAGIAVIDGQGDGQFQISYVVEAEEMVRAADAIDIIFSECGLEVELLLRIPRQAE